MIYRHGDVILQSIEKLPKSGQITTQVCLAEGEATGHHHMLTCEDGIDVVLEAKEILFKIESPGTLTHQEHDLITIDPGIYRVSREQEFDHFARTAKRVVD